MGQNLYWRTIPKGKTFKEKQGDALMIALRRKFDWNPAKLTYDHIEYLTGLKDGGLTDAQAVIDAIYKHEEIQIYFE